MVQGDSPSWPGNHISRSLRQLITQHPERQNGDMGSGAQLPLSSVFCSRPILGKCTVYFQNGSSLLREMSEHTCMDRPWTGFLGDFKCRHWLDRFLLSLASRWCLLSVFTWPLCICVLKFILPGTEAKWIKPPKSPCLNYYPLQNGLRCSHDLRSWTMTVTSTFW